MEPTDANSFSAKSMIWKSEEHKVLKTVSLTHKSWATGADEIS